MRAENFTLEQGYTLVLDGVTYDLHNDYDFIRFSYTSPDSKTVLLWQKCRGDWTDPDAPAYIRIAFSGTTFLMTVCEEDSDVSPHSTLEFAGYLHADDLQNMHGYLDRTEISDDYHLIFGFEGGMTIKLKAANGVAETLQAAPETPSGPNGSASKQNKVCSTRRPR